MTLRLWLTKFTIPFTAMNKSEFGIIGLGVMGKSLSLNIADHGIKLSVYNRNENEENGLVENFIKSHKEYNNIQGFTDLKSFVDSLNQPRKIFLMVKAGEVVDIVIQKLIPLLHPGDIVIDGGNSHFHDTQKRYKDLIKQNIHFIGCGVSGGEEGARKGPSLMPGGNKESYYLVAPILESIAAKDDLNNPCCSFIGNDGAGHFVKMIHNGIEYAEMQLIAELYAIMTTQMDNESISKIFSEWNSSDLSSYLLEITSEILIKKEDENYLLDYILDKAENKGTGSWSSKTALDIGLPNTLMTSSVFARYLSSLKDQRMIYAKHLKLNQKAFKIPSIKELENAYRFARLINHHQGFEIIKEASKLNEWSINLSELARIWTNGCIIRSKLMNKLAIVFKTNTSVFDDLSMFEQLKELESSSQELIVSALYNRVPLDTFSSAHNYWVAMTTKQLPANLIQAQRDYFGAHKYQRNDVDTGQWFHKNWKNK